MIYEIYVNGRLVNTVDNVEELDEALNIKKYKEDAGVFVEDFGQYEGELYLNYRTMIATTIIVRNRFPFTDKNGHRIYDTDKVRNEKGEVFSLNEKCTFDEGEPQYYIRNAQGTFDTDVTPNEISTMYEVIPDEFPILSDK